MRGKHAPTGSTRALPASDRRRTPVSAYRLSLAVQYRVATTTLPEKAALRRWAKAAQERDIAVLVRFVGTREAAALNAGFRGKDYATNVLTFVYDDVVPLAGDIVLCAPVLRSEARLAGKAPAQHIAHLVVHGMLHLQGYDHDTRRAARTMEARESAILVALGLSDPYADPCCGRFQRPQR